MKTDGRPDVPTSAGALADRLAIALMLAGLLLRLWNLGGRSFWLDEVLTANAARQDSLADVLAYVVSWGDQAPLLFLLTWLLQWLGDAEAIVRLPSALAGAATVGVVYLAGRALGRPRAGVLAALVIAILPFAVWYSQEARAYALLMLFTTAQMAFAQSLVMTWSWRRGGLFVAASTLNLYSSYLAVLTTATALGYVCLAWLLQRFGWGSGEGTQARRFGRSLVMVASVLVMTALAFSPWLAHFGDFLRAPNLGLGRMSTADAFAWATVTKTITALGFGGWLLVPLCLGLVVVCWACLSGRWHQGLVLLLWALLPAGALWWRTGWAWLGLLPRYLSFWVPLGALLVGIGLDHFATALSSALRLRSGSRVIVDVVAAAAVVALLAPALAADYSKPKEDYRAAARLIGATAEPGTIVFGLGSCGWVTAAPFEYYFWRQKTPALAVRDVQLDDRVLDALRQPSGEVWGAVFRGCRTDLPAPNGAVVMHSVPGLDLVTVSDPGLRPLERAAALMEWSSSFQPELRSVGPLLRRLADGSAGEDVLRLGQPASQAAWQFAPGVTADPGVTRIVLRPNGGEVNATWGLVSASPDTTYFVTFRCDNGDLSGDQRVYATTHAADGRVVRAFPDGGGYLCKSADRPRVGGFLFTVPPGAATFQLWFRASGTGSAVYDELALRLIR